MFYKFRSEVPLIDQLDFTKRVWSLIHDQENFGMAKAAAAAGISFDDLVERLAARAAARCHTRSGATP